jgi:hypothetical protein
LPPRPTPADVQYRYIDVNGDNHCTAVDALIVINYINRGQAGAGEGEAAEAAGWETTLELDAPASRLGAAGFGCVRGPSLGVRSPATPVDHRFAVRPPFEPRGPGDGDPHELPAHRGRLEQAAAWSSREESLDELGTFLVGLDDDLLEQIARDVARAWYGSPVV